ncbi:hypothetical protein ACF08E_10485 [Streptomyces globisporus]|uniref:hypothetical protein n=1 Tax=Streptomyces globisporus TaxID=1908 RepID=UPI0037022C49
MTDAECTLRYLVGLDVNMAFAVGANRLTDWLGDPTPAMNPVFDAKLPGSWLVDLVRAEVPAEFRRGPVDEVRQGRGLGWRHPGGRVLVLPSTCWSSR